MRIVIDACLPDWLVDALLPVVGPPRCQIEHVTRLYGKGAKDHDWIARLTEEGGALFLTFDRHMRRRPVEVQALIASHCIGIVLPPQWQDDDDPVLVGRLLFYWTQIESAATTMKPPLMLELPWAQRPRLPKPWRGWDRIAGRLKPPGAD